MDFNLPSVYVSLPSNVSAMSQHCVSLDIIDDQRHELAESFFLTVSGGNYITVPADLLEFVIIDNDGMFGFLDAYIYSKQRSL